MKSECCGAPAPEALELHLSPRGEDEPRSGREVWKPGSRRLLAAPGPAFAWRQPGKPSAPSCARREPALPLLLLRERERNRGALIWRSIARRQSRQASLRSGPGLGSHSRLRWGRYSREGTAPRARCKSPGPQHLLTFFDVRVRESATQQVEALFRLSGHEVSWQM